MNNCPVCKKHPATTHPSYGLLPCIECQSRRRQKAIPPIQPEMVGENIKGQRTEYLGSIIQPYRSGELSKEYLDVHGTKGISPSKEEVAKARNVWSDVTKDIDIKKTK